MITRNSCLLKILFLISSLLIEIEIEIEIENNKMNNEQ
jgi:hypothetical protein